MHSQTCTHTSRAAAQMTTNSPVLSARSFTSQFMEECVKGSTNPKHAPTIIESLEQQIKAGFRLDSVWRGVLDNAYRALRHADPKAVS